MCDAFVTQTPEPSAELPLSTQTPLLGKMTGGARGGEGAAGGKGGDDGDGDCGGSSGDVGGDGGTPSQGQKR